MKYYYSSKSNSFVIDINKSAYDDAGSWPDDAVEVDEEVFMTFTTNPPEGKIRQGGENGLPAWVDTPSPTREELTIQNESKRSQLKRVADSEIVWRQDAVDAEMATDEEASALTKWKKYRVLLMRVDINSPKWPKVPS